MFSARLPAELAPNALSVAVTEARGTGRLAWDLTETNPTRVGLSYPSFLTSALADPAILDYQPQPLGTLGARRAVAASIGAGPAQVVLTASTSEAYSFLFKLLCDPGDEVLVPRPSYPLFELLTRLDGVREVAYRLDPLGGWCLDRESVLAAMGPRTRAVLVVSPNNPTGSVLHADDRDWLVDLAARRRLAIVADEVFAPFQFGHQHSGVSLQGESRALTFTLGGLSKSAGLPQMKLAWIVASGPEGELADAMERLAVIADSYLSVGTPVQVAVDRLIEAGATVRAAISHRTIENLATLRAAVAGAPAMTLLEPEGGWSAVVRVPAILSGEQLVLRLLDEQGVLVHPGYFFDIDDEGAVVVSLLPEPSVFAGGVARLARFVSGVTG